MNTLTTMASTGRRMNISVRRMIIDPRKEDVLF
jgi:hypothetical protein